MPPETDTGTQRKKQRIFFVDDEVSAVELYTRILKREGYEVDSATDSRKALVILMANPEKYDVLVSDYRMPCLNGHELIEQARKNGFRGKTVIFSGHVPNDSETWRREMEVDAVAQKASTASLVTAVEQVTN